MQAGYFRWKASAPSVKKLNALACQNFGIELVFFGPEDIDIESEQINGEVYENNNWKKKVTSVPNIINNTPYKSKNERLFHFLEDRSHLMFQSFGGKRKEYNLLKDEKTLSYALIPSVRIKDIKHVQDFITEHGKVIFKPLQKNNKQMMFTIEKGHNQYVINNGGEETSLAPTDFEQIYQQLIRGQGLEMSKYIASTTTSGQPFCIRVDMEKNEEGKWIRAQNYVNISFQHKLSANLKYGGGVVKTKSFLTANFDLEKSKEISDRINAIARKLPQVLEKELNFDINAIGLDLGIDQDGKVYIFEYGTYPDSTFAVGQVALFRAGYMQYYLKNYTERMN